MTRPTARTLLSWSAQLSLLLLLWWGISLWQQRALVTNGEPAPEFQLTSLSGHPVSLQQLRGQPTLLYFFAPWCSVCKLSIGNLDSLHTEEVNVAAVALSYHSVDEVRRFIGNQQLEVPVLLSTPQTGQDYRIELFPTYYVLDAEGRVVSKSVGYATELGMQLRMLH